MTTIAEMITMVKDEINLGNEFDAIIPRKIAQAVRLAERKVTFPYMRVPTAYTFTIGDSSVELSTLITDKELLKEIEYWRFTLADGSFHYAQKIDPQDIAEIDSLATPPNGYCIKGNSTIQFDRKMAESYTTEAGLVLYTAFPTDTSQTLWLLSNAEDFILAQTMLNLSPTLKDPELYTLWKGLRDDALIDLIDTALEYDLTNNNYTLEPDNVIRFS